MLTLVQGLVEHKLVTTLSDNLTTSFTDDVLDGSLGASVLTPLTSTGSALKQFPEDFHLTLLLAGLKQRLKHSKGDIRDAKGLQDWRNEVKRFWGYTKQGQNVPTAVAPYAPTRRHGLTARDHFRSRIPTS